jgi:Predicted transcriptional regulators
VEWVFNGDRPIWIQLHEQLRQRIVTGVYPSGERLPAVRELAAEAEVNPNTMQRALAQLEADGLALTNRTAGRVVTDNEEVLKMERMKMAQERIREYLESMAVLGFTVEEAKELLVRREQEENG